MNNIKNLKLFSKSCEILRSDNDIFVTKAIASVFLLIKVSSADKKINKTEISYLKRYTRYFLGINKDVSSSFVINLLKSYKLNRYMDNHQEDFITFLGQNLEDEEKMSFLSTLTAISRSDLEMQDKEKEVIRTIENSLKISSKDINEMFINATFIMLNKQMEETAASPDYITTEKEIKEIKLID